MMSPISEEVPYGLEFKRETCCQDLMVVAFPWLKTWQDFSKFHDHTRFSIIIIIMIIMIIIIFIIIIIIFIFIIIIIVVVVIIIIIIVIIDLLIYY